MDIKKVCDVLKSIAEHAVNIISSASVGTLLEKREDIHVSPVALPNLNPQG